jgi:hypothetical protein
MGLDGVELILAIEARFKIEIPDADVSGLTTPRKLIDYVANRLNAGSLAPTPCLTSAAFHKVRREVLDLTGCTKSSVYPSTLLEKVFPKEQRRTLWPKLQQRINVKKWPTLVRPSWLSRIIWYLVSICFLIFLIYFSSLFPGNISLLLASAVCGVIAVVLHFFTLSFATQFRPMTFTVGDLSRIVLAQAPMFDDFDESPQKIWTREEIAAITRGIIMEQLGITSFGDDEHFVNDLGVD